MTDSRNLTEAQRWLKQAVHDRAAARLNRDHGFRPVVVSQRVIPSVASSGAKDLPLFPRRFLAAELRMLGMTNRAWRTLQTDPLPNAAG
jgi:hypothetical protein